MPKAQLANAFAFGNIKIPSKFNSMGSGLKILSGLIIRQRFKSGADRTKTTICEIVKVVDIVMQLADRQRLCLRPNIFFLEIAEGMTLRYFSACEVKHASALYCNLS
jgi:hypothetical protein